MGEQIEDLRLRSRIKVKKYPFNITHANKVMLIGSCFTNHFSQYLSKHKFSCLKNPFGTSFNPISISSQIIQICNHIQLSANDLILNDDIYFHYDFHSEYSSIDAKQTVVQINKSISKAHDFLKTTDYLILTLGTAWVHKHLAQNKIVNNCHKQPATLFEK